MITFDCLRPDRLGFNGYRGVETPAFDSLAEESLVFERAYCQTPNTWVAHASLFTGTYPARHGVRTPRSGISPDVGTLAEALSDAGYETHGLPAVGMLRSELGFGRGFDTYTLEGTRGPKLRYDNPQYRPAARSLQMAKERIENARRPFFLWIHHFGIHWIAEDALALPAEYRDRFSEYAQFYDGKVSYADAALLRPLIAYLKEADLWDETAIVLLSDHGENLDWVESRRGRSAHNFDLREEAIRTLLMIRLKSGRPAGRRADIANSVDVLPTICEICGVEPPRTNQGRSLLSSDREGEGTAAYVECLCQGCVGVVRNRRKLVLVMDSIHGPRPVWAAKGARKLLHSLKRRTLRAVG
ncbi:MAG: sulfatase, partial [Candidatus Brocadiia bacterium]